MPGDSMDMIFENTHEPKKGFSQLTDKIKAHPSLVCLGIICTLLVGSVIWISLAEANCEARLGFEEMTIEELTAENVNLKNQTDLLSRKKDPSDCPPDWRWFEGRCFVFVDNALNWTDAEMCCLSHGGNLASFHNLEEYILITDLISQTTGAFTTSWVGGNDGVKDGVWMWSDGSTFNFTIWHAGEPNNYFTHEDCMEINSAGQDWVNDAPCDQLSPFVCAKHV